jgi:hypothetical protein
LPSATPQDRRRRLRPDAECAGLGDVGAVGDDARDEVLKVIIGAICRQRADRALLRVG